MATIVEEPGAVAEDSRAIAPSPVEVEDGQRFVLDGISWDDYEGILAILGDRPIRVTYDRGVLELMSPSAPHEEAGGLLGRIVHIVCEELDIPFVGLRSTTWRRRLQDRGIEAAECFYLANPGRILAKKRKIDLNIDPPPDLCIEVEITRSALDRLGVYAGLGIPEVWRYDEAALRILALQADGTYAPRERSPSLPFLPPSEVVRLVHEAEGIDHMRWGKRVRAWVREAILPAYVPLAAHAD